MPQLGESVAEGTIGKWLKKPGDSVAKYEPLLEVITDKVNAEVPSPTASTMPERSAPAATERPAAQAGPAASSAAVGRAAAMELPGREDARMTPAVRRLLREHDLSPAMIVGTGGGGRISREDVLNYVEAARTGQPVGGQTAERAPAAGTPSAQPAPAPARAPAAGAAAAPAPAAPATPAPTFAPGEDEQLVPWTQM